MYLSFLYLTLLQKMWASFRRLDNEIWNCTDMSGSVTALKIVVITSSRWEAGIELQIWNFIDSNLEYYIQITSMNT